MTRARKDSHERIVGAENITASSDRSFGFVFAGFFAIVTVYSFYFDGSRWPIWLGLAGVFAALAALRPALLAPLNKLWTRLGLLLLKVISPAVLGFIFYLVITPIGWMMRRTGKDPMRLQADKDTSTYWLPREPPGPESDTFSNQF